MENASKALLIAGAMLLAILLLSVFAFINSKMAETTTNIYGELKASDITEFNQRFLNFEEKAYKMQDGLTMQDVISLANLAKDCNKRTNFPVTVEIRLTATNIETEWNNIDLATVDNDILEEDFLKKHFDATFKNCSVTYAPNSKLIGKVEISN